MRDVVRRNLVVGLLLVTTGLLAGAFMSSARDLAVVERWLSYPAVRSNQVMYAHAHLGVLGLMNIVLGFVLPLAGLSLRLVAAASWAAAGAGVLVPLGMLLALLPAPWDKFVYLQAAGFVMLLLATIVAMVGLMRRGSVET